MQDSFSWNTLKRIVAASALAIVGLLGSQRAAAETAEPPLPAIQRASWIWGDMRNDLAEFRVEFEIDAAPTAARVLITADNGYELHVN